jgi:hypothetical protein
VPTQILHSGSAHCLYEPELIGVATLIERFFRVVDGIRNLGDDTNGELLRCGKREQRRSLHFDREYAGLGIVLQLLVRFSVRGVSSPDHAT